MDNSEHIEAEKELKRERKSLRNIMATIPDSMLILDRELRIKSANRPFYKLFQTKPEKIIGRKIADVLGDIDGKLSAELTRLFGTEKTLRNFEWRYQSEGLGERILNITARGVIVAEEEEEEEEEEQLLVLQDITERKRAEDALRESEERYRTLVESALDVIFTVSLDGTITSLNPAFEAITGRSRSEWIGKQFASLVHPDDLPTVMAFLQDVGKGEVPQFGEVRISTKSGEYLLMETRGAPQTQNERVVGFLGIIRDITERKRAEEALRESEQRYRALFESTLDGSFVIDAETMKVVLANEAAASIFGFDSAEDVIGVSPLDFVPPDERDRVIRIIGEDMFAKDLRQVNEFRTITRDGREIWIRAVGVRTEYQGRLAGLVSFWDITERKQAEEALKESEEKYRTLVNNISLGIFRSTPGPKGRFLEMNPAMERITGYSREELLQMNVSDLYQHPEERERVLDEVASATGMTTRELQLKRKDGSEIIVSDTKIAVRNDAGQIMYFDGIMEDITEKKKLEAEEQKIERLESIGTLAGGIAHDFNNILTGILGNITLAERHIESEGKTAERLLEARKASLRARDLTQQLLTFSKGGAPIKKTASIAELIQDSATFALRGSKVRCEFSLPDDLWPVEVDEGQMNQVITNVVINADQAMPGGGTVNIGAKNTIIKRKGALPLPKGNYVEITVEDHGVGIAKEHLGRIFEPYFTTKQKGSGLGLATAYSVIKNHDGYVTVESELGVGTTFHIYLPASKKPAPAKKEAGEEAPVRGKGRILVMDDEEMIRLLLSRMLTGAGYDVELTACILILVY